MTKREAKALSLKVWQYFKEHPEVKHKEDLPKDLWDKVNHMLGYCPLCEYHGMNCWKCILKHCHYGSPFVIWREANDNDTRQKAAQAIYDKIKSWEVK